MEIVDSAHKYTCIINKPIVTIPQWKLLLFMIWYIFFKLKKNNLQVQGSIREGLEIKSDFAISVGVTPLKHGSVLKVINEKKGIKKE